MSKYNYNKAYKGARLIRANANIGEHYYDLVGTQGYDEYPIDPAILQQAENYTFGDSAIPLLRQFLDHNLAQADQEEMFPHARFCLLDDPAFTLNRNP